MIIQSEHSEQTSKSLHTHIWFLFNRGVVPGGAGGAMTPPDFGR